MTIFLVSIVYMFFMVTYSFLPNYDRTDRKSPEYRFSQSRKVVIYYGFGVFANNLNDTKHHTGTNLAIYKKVSVKNRKNHPILDKNP